MDATFEGNRCKRTGTNWRCREMSVAGKNYCHKHQLYMDNRNNRHKTNTLTTISGGASAVECDSSTAAVEPYRPVIDFGAREVGGGGDGGIVGSFVNEGEIMGWLLGGVDGGSGGSEGFTLPDLGVRNFGSVGALVGNDGGAGRRNGDFDLGEESGGMYSSRLDWGRNDDYILDGLSGVIKSGDGRGTGNSTLGDVTCGELGHGSSSQLGWSGNYNSVHNGFNYGSNECVLTGTGNKSTNVYEKQESICEGSETKCGGSRSRQEFGNISEMTESSAWNGTVSVAKGAGALIGEGGCNDNAIVIGIEATSMAGHGQKRKRGRSTGSRTTKKVAYNGEACI